MYSAMGLGSSNANWLKKLGVKSYISKFQIGIFACFSLGKS